MASRSFGELLKELRIQSGLTQKQLGERIGVSKSVISFYELQSRTPSPDVLKKLALEFHVSGDYLLGIEKTPSIDVSGLDAEDIAVVRHVIDGLRRNKKK